MERSFRNFPPISNRLEPAFQQLCHPLLQHRLAVLASSGPKQVASLSCFTNVSLPAENGPDVLKMDKMSVRS